MSQTKAISGPYLRTEQTTRNIMLHVSISLIPALFGAVYYFGIKAFYLTAFSVTLCVLTEFFMAESDEKAGYRRGFQRSGHRNAPGL